VKRATWPGSLGPLIVFVTRADFEAMHLGLSAALAAVSMGRKVELFFFWFALERLAKQKMDEPDIRADIADAMERRQVPTLRELYQQVRDSGLATSFACSGSLAALGLLPTDVEKHVDALIGWASILQRTHGATDRLTF
jgi:predicted peroxiredoxin